MKGSVSFVDIGFDIHKVYNLMVAIKIGNENSIDHASNIDYWIGKCQGTSMAFKYVVTEIGCYWFSEIWSHYDLR